MCIYVYVSVRFLINGNPFLCACAFRAQSGFAVTPVAVVESGPLVARLRWSVEISPASTLSQEIELSSESPFLVFSTYVSWHENRKIMKALFDTNIHTNKASFDIQFGHLERPTHMNTSWDSARYEVCGHK